MAKSSFRAVKETDVKLPSDGKLDFDDDNLRAIAEVYKKEGNDEFVQKQYMNAVHFYTEGIKVNCKDDELNAKLYNNRATAHFYLADYQETLNDAEDAIKLQPTYTKAMERGASACVKLHMYDEAIIWCDKGIAIDKNDKKLFDLRTKCVHERDKLQKHQEKEKIVLGSQCADEQEMKESNEEERAYSVLGNTIEHLNEELQIAIEEGDRDTEGHAYRNLGNAYYSLRDFKKALHYYQLDLTISKQIGARSREFQGYVKLGTCHYHLGDFKKAIEYYQLLLKISKEVGNKARELEAYGLLGQIHYDLRDFIKAVVYHETFLDIAKKFEVRNRDRQESVHCSVGNAHRNLGDFNKAIAYYKLYVDFVKELGYRAGEVGIYANLGTAHYKLGDFKKAITYYELHLYVAKEAGIIAKEGYVYSYLANAYHNLRDLKKAIAYHERYLHVVKESGNRAEEGHACASLGRAHYKLCDFKKAIVYYELHLNISKEMKNKADEGYAYQNLGDAYFSLGDSKKAAELYEKLVTIAKLMGDREWEGSVCASLGTFYLSLGNVKKAIDYNELSLNIVREIGVRWEGRVYRNLGQAYMSQGNFQKALDYFERSLNITKQRGDREGEGSAYGGLGLAELRLGKCERALEHIEHHLKIAKEMGDKIAEAAAYSGLGEVYQKLGDFKNAIENHDHCLKINKEISVRLGEQNAYSSLGEAYLALGDFKRALAYFESYLKIAEEMDDYAGVGIAYGNIGVAFLGLGDFTKALTYHQRHTKIVKELGLKDREGCAYSYLGITFEMLGDLRNAIDCHEHSLKIAKELGLRDAEGGAYVNLSIIYQKLGDFTKATDYAQRGLKLAKKLSDGAIVAKVFHCLGRSLESQGSLQDALDCFQSSVKMFSEVRDRLEFNDEWKISLSDFYQNTYTSLWRLLLKQGRIVEALSAAEQGRAQALKDLVELKYGFKRLEDGSSTVTETCSDATMTFTSFPSNTIFMAVDKEKIVFWVIQKEDNVTARKKQICDNDLQDNASTLLTSLTRIAFEEIGVRTGVKCEDRSLNPARDEKLEDESDEHTRLPSLQLQKGVLQTLFDFIIGPIADLVHGDEIIFVPHGPLCLAPYAALVDSNAKYLSESFRIRVIPSLTSLKLIADSPEDFHSNTGALLVGDPWVQEVNSHGRKLQQLPCAREEVEMIARLLNTEPVTGTEATKDEVLKRLSSVALVHIAAHGHMETGEIALAPNTTRASEIPIEEDFILTTKDVLSAQMRARLVVLSCCHSGRGEIKAEGVVGIARAFLGAGARSVLVSLWAIDDEATLEFMKSFYQRLVQGRSASEALNGAMKCLRESDKFSEVKYWAPFVLIGDDVTLELDGREKIP